MAPRLKTVQYEQVQKRFLNLAAKYGWLMEDFAVGDSLPEFGFDQPEEPSASSTSSTSSSTSPTTSPTTEVISLIDDEPGLVTKGAESHRDAEDEAGRQDDDGQGDVENLGLNGVADEVADDLPPFFKESMGSKKRQSFARRSLRAQLKFDPDEEEDDDDSVALPRSKPKVSKRKIIDDDGEEEDQISSQGSEIPMERLSLTNQPEDGIAEVPQSNGQDEGEEEEFYDAEDRAVEAAEVVEVEPTGGRADLHDHSDHQHEDEENSQRSVPFSDGLDDYYFQGSQTTFDQPENLADSPLKPPFAEESPLTPKANKQPAAPKNLEAQQPEPVTPRTENKENVEAFFTPAQTPRQKKPSTMQQFKEDRVYLAYQLYAEYNRTVFESQLPASMAIEWSVHLNTTAGRTHLLSSIRGDNVERKASIELSTKVIDSLDRLQKTLAHEMCHAAAWLINGTSSPPHGPAFKSWGAAVEKKHPGVHVTTCHSYEINFKYRYLCTEPGCQKVYPRHSKSVDLELQRCRCGGRLELEQKLKKDGTPMKPRAPSAWQDFIKANMKAAKLENPGSTQSEIMGILKDRYQQTKQGSQRSHPIVLDDD